MNEIEHTLSIETCQALLREIDPSSTVVSVRPMGAEGTHPAFVIETRTATGAALQLAVKCYSSKVGQTCPYRIQDLADVAEICRASANADLSG